MLHWLFYTIIDRIFGPPWGPGPGVITPPTPPLDANVLNREAKRIESNSGKEKLGLERRFEIVMKEPYTI